MMFNNLIESSSHKKEYKRRGSFFLVTTATYAVMLMMSAVASIYAYDARLEDQIYQEVVTMLPVPEAAPAPPRAVTPRDRAPSESNRSRLPEREVAMLDVNRPDLPPEKVSVTPNKVLPLPPGGALITGRDWNPPMPTGGTGSTGSGGTRIMPPATVILEGELPPEPPKPTTPKIIKSKGVLNGMALELPKPRYPPLAIQIRLQASVNVQVLIDEKGNVVSAKALGGHPMFVQEATNAAMKAKFSPTMLGEQAVKVSGIITYNFKLP